MKRKTTLAGLLLLAAMPLAAFGADPAGDPYVPPASPGPAAPGSGPSSPGSAPSAKEKLPPFGSLDTNRDGHLTKAELKAAPDVQSRFKELDTDRDGKISVTEYSKALESKEPKS